MCLYDICIYCVTLCTCIFSELYIVKVAQSKNFLPTNGILKWETLLAQGETFIFGLGINFLILTAYNSKNESLLQREGNTILMFYSTKME